MTSEEFAKIAMAMQAMYPREKLFPSKTAMDIWWQMLNDIPYQVADAGLRKWASTNKWSPSIADLRSMASRIQTGEMPEWGEGWQQVMNAIRYFGYPRQEEAMASFDEITRQTVEQVGGFMKLCMSENVDADRANFRDVYTRIATRKAEERQVPTVVRDRIEAILDVPVIETTKETEPVAEEKDTNEAPDDLIERFWAKMNETN